MANSLARTLAIRAAVAAAIAVALSAAARSFVPAPAYVFEVGAIALTSLSAFVLIRGALKPFAALMAALDDGAPTEHTQLENLAAEHGGEIGVLAGRIAELSSGGAASEGRQRQSDDRAEALAGALPDAVFWLDRSGRVTDYRRSEGVPPFPKEPPQREHALSDLFPETIAAAVRHAFDLVFVQDGPQQFDFTIDTGVDDTTRAIPYRARLSRCGEDSAVALVREVMEQRFLGATPQELDNLFHASIDPILIVSRNEVIREANPAAHEWLRLDSAQEIGLGDVIPKWAQPLVSVTAIPSALRDGTWQGESALIRSDGEEIPVSLTVVAHRTAAGPGDSVTLIARDLSERQRRDDELAYVIEHDPLTALYTRRRFVQELEKRLEPDDGVAPVGAVVVLDLDDLRYVNESLGHGTGDRLLVGLAQTLRRHFDSAEVLARLDGDEFAVLMDDNRRSHVESSVERILEAVRSHVVAAGSERVGISASAGLVLYPEHGTSAEELLARAERALGVAKERGRNQFVVYSNDDSRELVVASRLAQEKSIRDALEHDGFVLFAQPIVDLRSGRVSQYEVLLRMLTEDGDLLAPSEFLETAEKFGLIQSINRWVVRESIRVLGRQRTLGHDIRLSVNLSGKSVGDFELTALIEKELADNGVEPRSLGFEITETTAVSDVERSKVFAIALKQIGCRIALDDFGVGWSSFHKLKSMPIDYLKIDGSFIRNMNTNKVDQHLVQAIVDVAHALRKRTVAEFVGCVETLELLREAGVDLVQGNYIGQAEPLESFLQAYPGASTQEPASTREPATTTT